MAQRTFSISVSSSTLIGVIALVGALIAGTWTYRSNVADDYAHRSKTQDIAHHASHRALVRDVAGRDPRALIIDAQVAYPEMNFRIVRPAPLANAHAAQENHVAALGSVFIPGERRLTTRIPGSDLALESTLSFEGIASKALFGLIPWMVALLLAGMAWIHRSPANQNEPEAPVAEQRLPTPPKRSGLSPVIPLNVPMSTATAALLAEASMRSITLKRRTQNDGGTVAKINPPEYFSKTKNAGESNTAIAHGSRKESRLKT